MVAMRHSIENIDGTDFNLFELVIEPALAPASSSQRTFTVQHHPPPVPGKPRPAPAPLPGVRAIGMGQVAVSGVGTPLPPREEDPIRTHWRVSVPANSFLGELIFRAEWEAASSGARNVFEERVPAGTRLSPDPVNIMLKTAVPQVGSRINEVGPAFVSASATTPDDKGIEILQHVQRMLDEGLAPVWASIEGLPSKDGVPVSAVDDFGTLTDQETEEAWAQLISEWLVGTPYAGPGVNHFGTNQGDQRLFGKAVDDADPAYPIIYACQHLCTIAAVSRGIADAAVRQIDARSAGAVANWRPDAGALTEGSAANNNRSAEAALGNELLKPGTTYVASDVAHVAFVLRAFQSGRMQLIDTGGMRTDPPPRSPFGSAGSVDFSASELTLGGLNFDTQLVSAITRPVRHLANFPATDVRTALRRMRRARPLGVARLILLDRLPDAEARQRTMDSRLRYSSPLLPMWFQDNNYSILRLLWALRSHPHREEFEARWWVAFPQHAVAERVLSSREFAFTQADEAARPTPRQFLHPAVYLGSLPNGQVRFIGRFATEIEEGRTVGRWFDAILNRKMNNAVTPTVSERSLPLLRARGTASDAPSANQPMLLAVAPARVPAYFAARG